MSKKFSLHHFYIGTKASRQMTDVIEQYSRKLGSTLVSENLALSYWTLRPNKIGHVLLEGRLDMYCPLVTDTASSVLDTVPEAIDNWCKKSEQEDTHFLVPPNYPTTFSSVLQVSLIHHYVPYYDEELGIRRVQSELQLWYIHTHQ